MADRQKTDGNSKASAADKGQDLLPAIKLPGGGGGQRNLREVCSKPRDRNRGPQPAGLHHAEPLRLLSEAFTLI